MEQFHKWISINDISSTTEHWLKRLPDKEPISSVNDVRFQWLEEFIAKMKEWRKEVGRLVAFVPAAGKLGQKAKKTGMTKETHDALILFTTNVPSTLSGFS